MSHLYQPGQHPDADQLSAFVEHALPAHEREATLAHLATCPGCREIVALSMPPLEEVLPAPKPVRRPWFSGWWFALPGAIAAPILVFLVVLAVHKNKTPENVAVVHPPPMQQVVPEQPRKEAPEPVRPPAATPLPAKPQPQPPVQLHPPSEKEAAAPMLDAQSVENLPLEGRNVTPLPEAPAAKRVPAPAAGGVLGGLGAAAPQSAAPLQSTVNINGLQLPPEKAARAMALRQRVRFLPMAPLPSSLPIVSTAVSGIRVLALDTQNTLYRSDDAGQHWSPVPVAWTGRVLRVDVATTGVRAAAAPALAAPSRALNYAGTAPGGPGSLSGIITDATGAAVPGATVTVASRTTQADASGHYALSNLPAGAYTLGASSPGFQTLARPVTITGTNPTVADLKLSIGSVSETVTVSSANSAIDLISTPSVDLAPAAPSPGFELTTEQGERWTSPDGKIWVRR